MWERGLKPLGALLLNVGEVAPHVGAWIETDFLTIGQSQYVSLPMWERGLKLNHGGGICGGICRSLPMWERGLKQLYSSSRKGSICRSPCGSVD